MAKKFRVKINDERIVGPLLIEEVLKIYENGHITETNSIQLFPNGDWEQLKDVMDGLGHETYDDEQVNQTIIKIKALEKLKLMEKASKVEKSEIIEKPENLNEFVYSKQDDKIEVDYDKLESDFQEKEQKRKKEATQIEAPSKKVEATEVIKESVEDNTEKTILRVAPKGSIEKTRIVKIEHADIEAEPVIVEKEKEKEKEDKTREIKEVVSSSDETQFVDLGKELALIKTEAVKSEKKYQTKEEDSEEEYEEDEDEEDKPKTRPLILVIVCLLLWYLLDEEPTTKEVKKATLKPIFTVVKFPSKAEFLDEQKSKGHYKIARKLLMRKDYKSSLKAIESLKKSLYFKFSNNEAMYDLAYVYAKNLDSTKNKLSSARILHNIIRLIESKQLTNLTVAKAIAIYYFKMGKYKTSQKIIENYLNVSKTPDVEMMSLLLKNKIKIGNFVESKKIYNKVLSVMAEESAFLAVSEFHNINQELSKEVEVLKSGFQKLPNSIPITLSFAEALIRKGNLETASKLINVVKKKGGGSSPESIAKFFELVGIKKVIESKGPKDNLIAAKLFKLSLELNESDTLRSRLSSLSIGGEALTKSLIIESKILRHMEEARKYIAKYDWSNAFLYAIKAADLSKTYIPAQLLLADVQLRRGYFISAEETLVKLRKIYPKNLNISFKLIDMYLRARKLNNVYQQLNILSASQKSFSSAEYKSRLAQYYELKGDVNTAIKWYTEATRTNPLSDSDFYRLAKLFIKYRKYDLGIKNISSAINLDPLNSSYRVAYSRILFERDGPDVALGYLRDYLENRIDDFIVLSEMAIYYFESGQTKEFERYKGIVESKSKKDPSFYRFMVKTSELYDNKKETLEYLEKLIEVDPADLESKIKLAEIYLEQKNFARSLGILDEIKKSYQVYPKLYFFYSKNHLDQKNYKLALEFAKKEVEFNETIPDGYYIMAKCYEGMEKYLEAQQSYEKAIVINHKHFPSLMGLGVLQAKQKKFHQARELLIRAYRQRKENPAVHRELGHVYKALGQGALAIQSFETYLQLVPGTPDTANIKRIISILK